MKPPYLMIVLHLAILDNRIHLLPEKPQAGERANPLQPVVEEGMPPDFPNAPNDTELRKALKAFCPELRWTKTSTRTVSAWVPARDSAPVPSHSDDLKEAYEYTSGIELLPYRVRVLPLQWTELDTLLDLSSAGRSPIRGVIWGESVFWMLRLRELAIHLTRMEAFLPFLVQSEPGWDARWIPVPDEEQTNALRELAEAMPGVARCLTPHAKQKPSDRAITVTQRILASWIDQVIRETATGSNKRAFASIHDAWISALQSQDSRVHWSSETDLKAFLSDLEHWQRPIDAISRSPFRLCLRLSEPEDLHGKWNLEYLIQPKADPSLLIPLRDIWENRGDSTRLLKSYGGSLIEFTLSALSQAGSIVKEIGQSLHTPQPDQGIFDTARAHQFLSDETPILRSAGFGLMLPKWWTGQRKNITLRAKATANDSVSSGILSLSNLLQVDYEVAMGETILSREELETLARSRMGLVQNRGEWMEVDPDQIAKVLKFLEKHPSGRIQASEMLRIGLGGSGEIQGITVSGVETDGWVRNLLDKLTGQVDFDLLPQPDSLVGQLRPYQQKGFSWLTFLAQWGLGSCLADDMGLGKTLQCLAFLDNRRIHGESNPVLLLCPTSVVNNWDKEASRFTPSIKTYIHHGSKRLRGDELKDRAHKCHLLITSYGHLLRDHTTLTGIKWSGLILDEAQSIKNHQAKLSKAVRSIQSDYRIAMTGTPVENHVGELWSHLDFLNPGWLGSHEHFKRRFFVPIQKYHDSDAVETLRKLTGPFILRRLKTDKSIISDLPDKIETREWCNLTQEQAALYRSVVADAEEKLEQAYGIERRGIVLGLLSRLKQVCNHPAQFLGDQSSLEGRSGKLARVTELVEELREADDRVLIFTQFREMGTLIQRHFREILAETVFFLHGGTPKPERDRMIDHFQNADDAPGVFVLSLKAAGTGITLTRANHVIHYDRWWNPAVEDQATDRAFRIGQKRNVQVHKLVVVGTLEERIDALIESKNKLNTSLVGAGEDWLTDLSNEDLRELVKLGKDAIDE